MKNRSPQETHRIRRAIAAKRPGRSPLFSVFLLAFVLGLPPSGARAQFGLPPLGDLKVEWSARFLREQAAPGQRIVLETTAVIAPSWHIYGQILEHKGPLPTTFEATLPDGWTAEGDWTPSVPPRAAFDPGFQFDVTYHEGTVHFRLPVRLPEDAAPGGVVVEGRVRSQACDDKECLPPLWYDWTAEVEVVAAAPDAVPTPSEAEREILAAFDAASATAPGPETAPEASAAAPGEPGVAAPEPPSAAPGMPALGGEGFFAFLMLAVVAGLASLLTPCVFPMIPITVAFFTKKSDRTPRQGVLLAFVYAAGIVVTFSSLGILLSIVLGLLHGVGGAGAIGTIASNPWVNLGLASLFVFFALSLFGLFELQLPAGLANSLQKVGGGRGEVLGALIMAVVFTLTSFTCTVQFVGWLLVEAARGSWLWPTIGMVVYSSVFASPFFLLALFPQALSRLPRSGPWLHVTKVLMGFLILAVAFKFVSNADLVWMWGFFNRELVLAAWAAIALFTGLYLLGKFRLAGESPDTKPLGVPRMLFSLVFVTLSLYLASGLTGARLHGSVETYLPSRLPGAIGGAGWEAGGARGGAGEARPRLEWIKEYDAGLALARERDLPVFVDFTGVTCTNCRWMEINIFPRPEIESLFGEFVLLKLYTDTAEESARRYQRMQAERFGTVSLPYYVVMRPDETVVSTLGGLTRDPERFAAFLREGLEKAGAKPE